MAPYTISGHNLCPMAEMAECHIACLNTAGNPAYADTKAKGRLNKARYFIEARESFMVQLACEIYRETKKIIAQGFTPLVRLNGTTDIRWEIISITIDDKTSKRIGKPSGEYANIFALFPEIQFYDYTKIPNRKNTPSNYDLTFSYSGVLKFQKYANIAIKNGMRLAVVFRTQKSIPIKFLGMQCVDGDDSDIRHLDPNGVVVALYAKGKAKMDTTGFVIDSHPAIPLMQA